MKAYSALCLPTTNAIINDNIGQGLSCQPIAGPSAHRRRAQRQIEINVLQRCASHLASATDQSEAFALGEHAVLLAEEGVTASMVTLTRTSNTPYAVAYDNAPIRGIANEAKSIPREWINAHGNDIRQELYNYLYPLIQGEVSLTYQNGVPVYMPVPHLKPDHVS